MKSLCSCSLLIVFAILFSTGCSAPIALQGYSSSESALDLPEEACKLPEDFEKVTVLSKLPPEGTYEELGMILVSQESSSELFVVSDVKQIKAARKQACRWGADAIVIVYSDADQSSNWWSGKVNKTKQNRLVAIKFVVTANAP